MCCIYSDYGSLQTIPVATPKSRFIRLIPDLSAQRLGLRAVRLTISRTTFLHKNTRPPAVRLGCEWSDKHCGAAGRRVNSTPSRTSPQMRRREFRPVSQVFPLHWRRRAWESSERGMHAGVGFSFRHPGGRKAASIVTEGYFWQNIVWPSCIVSAYY